MDVSVYVVVAGVYREFLAEGSVEFAVTEQLNGHLLVNGRQAAVGEEEEVGHFPTILVRVLCLPENATVLDVTSVPFVPQGVHG